MIEINYFSFGGHSASPSDFITEVFSDVWAFDFGSKILFLSFQKNALGKLSHHWQFKELNFNRFYTTMTSMFLEDSC
jgi:hypothetical protein